MNVKGFNQVKKLDLFGRDIRLQINQVEKFQTTVGGCLTILLTISMMTLTWYFGQEIYLRKNPKYIVKSEHLGKSPIFYPKKPNFFFGYRLEDRYGHLPIDFRFFDLEFVAESWSNNDTLGTYVLDKIIVKVPETCSEKHATKHQIDHMSVLHTCKCIDLNGIQFGGSWVQEKMDMIRFYLKRCNKNTEKRLNITCASDEEYFQRFKNQRLFYNFFLSEV